MTDRPHVVLVLGGDDGAAQAEVRLDPASFVVAADSGLHRADALGLTVDHLVGDLDSVAPDRATAAEAAGTVVHRHRADKDATDAELALRLARDLVGAGAAGARLTVVAGDGGRLDLVFADVLLLAGPLTEGFDVTAHVGPATVQVVRPGRSVEVRGAVGEQVSLLPVHGAAYGVATSGMRWALVDAVLAPGTTRGVSNELAARVATVGVDTGVVLVVQQGIVAPAPTDRDGTYDPTPRR